MNRIYNAPEDHVANSLKTYGAVPTKPKTRRFNCRQSSQ